MAYSSQSFTAPSIPKLNRRTISSPLSSSASKISGVTPTLKRSRIKFRSQGTSSPITASQSSIVNTLAETNTILVEIQSQLAYDFAMRIAEEKERNKVLKSDKSRRRLALKEGAIESTRKIGNIVKSATGKILAPVKGVFDKIIEFLSIIGTGIAANAAFEWLKDDENKQKLQGWFNFIVDHWKWGLAALGAVAALNLVGPISALVTVLKGATGLIVTALQVLGSPAGIAIIGSLLLSMGAGKAAEHFRKTREKQALQQEVSLGIKDPSKIGGDDGMTFEEYKIFNYMEPGFEGLQDATVDPRIERNRKRYEEVMSPDFDIMDETPQILQRKKTFSEKVGDFFRPAQKFIYGGEREMGGPVIAGQTYLVGEDGPELIVPKISGTVINNTKTEKIYKMISSKNAGKVNFVTMDLPPQVMKTEKSIPTPPAPPVPNISSTNAADLWRVKTPDIYGIYV